MNVEILKTLFRWVGTLIAGTSLGAALVAAGVFDTANIDKFVNLATALVTSAIGLFTLVWGIYQKVKAQKTLNAAIVAPAAELPK